MGADREAAISQRDSNMSEWLKLVTEKLQAAIMGPMALPLAFLLGLLSAIASACCTLPAMGVLVAYSAARGDITRRTAWLSAVWFLAGTTFALIILGLLAGLIGQSARAFLGQYWNILAGVAAVVFGMAALQLLPFKAPARLQNKGAFSGWIGSIEPMLGGLFLGGGVAAVSLPCNPGIYIATGASLLMGRILWAMLLMAAFGLGFSIPLTVILFGVSLGKVSLKIRKAETGIRTVAGVLLIGAGFYLLATF